MFGVGEFQLFSQTFQTSKAVQYHCNDDDENFLMMLVIASRAISSLEYHIWKIVDLFVICQPLSLIFMSKINGYEV